MSDKNTGKRFVFKSVNGILSEKIVTGDTPEGFYDLIKDAKLADPANLKAAPALTDTDASPVAGVNVAAAKIEIAKATDKEWLQSVIDLDARKGATDAAAARLAELGE